MDGKRWGGLMDKMRWIDGSRDVGGWRDMGVDRSILYMRGSVD